MRMPKKGYIITAVVSAVISAVVSIPATIGVMTDDEPAQSSCSQNVPLENHKPTTPQPTVEYLEPSGVCDHSVRVIDGKASCNPDVATINLPLDGSEARGFTGGVIGVIHGPDLTRITWRSQGAHVIIVNDKVWGYVDGIEDKQGLITDPMPPVTNMVSATWGDIQKVVLCSWGQ